LIDFLDQFLDAAKRPTTNGLLCNRCLRKRGSGKSKDEVLERHNTISKRHAFRRPSGRSKGGRAFGGYGEGAFEGDADATERAFVEEAAD